MNNLQADAYSSEEARLAAQRAMTEKFGLKIEDEDEDEGEEEEEDEGKDEGKDEEEYKGEEEKEEERGEVVDEGFEGDGGGEGKGQTKEDKEEEGTGEVEEGGEGEKEMEKEGSSDGKESGGVLDHGTLLQEKIEKGHEGIGKEEKNESWKLGDGEQGRRPVVLVGKPSARERGWPGVEIRANGEMARNGVYDVRKDKGLGERRLQVTPVTKYASMYGRGQGRRVAAGKRVVCYAVGGHVRVIARHVGDRALLKGHGASVVDMELLGEKEFGEGTGESNEGCWLVIVASVAEDGWAIIWRVKGPAVKFGTEGELKVEKVARVGYGAAWGYYSAVKWERSGQEDVRLTGSRTMALLDAQKKFVRLVSVEVDTGKIGETTQIGEEGDVFSSIEWIAKNCLAVAGGRVVKIWDVGARKTCLEHDVGADVLALHSMGKGGFEGWRLLVSVNGGRSLLVLGVEISLENMSIRCKITTVQTVKLKDITEDAYMSIAVVPGNDFFVMTDMSSQLLYAAHFNLLAGAIDTLTAMPLSSPALSVCATMGSSSHVSENQITGARRAEERLEISIWAIQPKAINLIHLPASRLLPHVPISSRADSAATLPAAAHQKAHSKVLENSQPTRTTAPVLAQTGTRSHSESASKGEPPGQVPIPIISSVAKDSEIRAATSSVPRILHAPSAKAVDFSSTTTTVDKSAAAENIFSPGSVPINWAEFKRIVQKGSSVERSPAAAAAAAEEDEKKRKKKEKKETKNSALSTASDTRKNNREMERSISVPPDPRSLFVFQGMTPEGSKSATKDAGPSRATDRKEAAPGASAGKNEPAQVGAVEPVPHSSDHKRKARQPKDPGVEILRAVEATVAKFEARGREQDEKEKRRTSRLRDTVRASTKDILKKAVDGSVGKTLTNALNAGWNSQEITTELFTAAIRDARVADGFGKACTEMRMQLISAISAGMEKKYETILAPVLGEAKTATTNLETTARSLKNIKPGVYGSSERTESQPSVEETIEKLLENGHLEVALAAALRTGDSSVFLDVCKKIDPHELFAEHKPSQLLVISITEQLGIGLSYDDEDRDLKLVWLDEALLAADISSNSPVRDGLLEVLQQLGEAIAAIRAEAMKNKDTAVRRKATMLGHVIKSIGSNLRR